MNTDRNRITDRIERDLNQIADRATPSSSAWEAIRQRIDEQDNNSESTMEVIMLSPDRNEPRNRSRTWMAVAASVAALALVGGLIVAANRDSDDQVPADQPQVSLPVAVAVPLPITVTYPDFADFELQELFVSSLADDTSTEQDTDPETDYLQAVFEITNPSADSGIRMVSHLELMRLDGPGLDGRVKAERVWNESHDRQGASLGLEPGESAVRQWSFPIPADLDPTTLTIQIGVDGELGAIIALDGSAATPSDQQATETLPGVEPPTQGIMNSVCTTTDFTPNEDGTITGPQNCVNEAAVLPIAAEASATLTIFSPEAPPSLFVSTDESGAANAGYTTGDGAVRYMGVAPGIGDFDGETIHILGRRPVGGERIPGISDWTTEPGDAPLPTTEAASISAEVTITCSAEFVSGSDTEQILDQSCTYTSDDPRFDRAPEVIRVRIVPADRSATTLAEYPLFVTGDTDGGYLFAGIAQDTTTLRGLGIRPGSGEFEGVLVHDVLSLATDDGGNLTGTIRSTIYGAD